MCGTCGCGSQGVLIAGKRPKLAAGELKFRQPQSGEVPVEARVIKLEQDIYAKNNQIAANNRHYLAAQHILALNFVSSPGSGKTSLLVETIRQLQHEIALAVIEGDQQTENDAARIRATNTPVIQINTGKGCHLDAAMIQQALPQLPLKSNSLLLIENVGNLVCPASFDLGERAKVVVLSVTEGEDKPLKYPDMFRAAQVMILNKVDLLPYLDFDLEQAVAYAKQVNPDLTIFQLSVRSGEGMATWLAWLKQHFDRNK